MAQLIVMLGLLLFVPAWTFDYPLAWLYLAVFAVAAGLITAYLAKHDPALLARRIRGGPRVETEPLQKAIQTAAAGAFIGMFFVVSLDHRFSWSHVPLAAAVAGDVAVLLGFFIVFRVFRENTYAGASIEVTADQTVISTGPYAIVRHPMYAGALVMLTGTPPALGSWWGLVLVLPMVAIIVARLRNEERFLASHLPGYEQYRHLVGQRLLPHIW